MLALLALVVVAVAVGALIATRESPPPPPKPDIPLDAWAPYWTLDASIPVADRRLDSLRDVSPFWFNATGVSDIVVDPSASPELTAEFLDKARNSTANVVPSIVDAMPAGGMAAVLADPATRAQHVEAIAAFAADGEYDGIDIDYEQFAFADGRDTWTATRPNWVAFITALGARLHADGRTLSVSIPPVYDAGQTVDSGYWVYDYGGDRPPRRHDPHHGVRLLHRAGGPDRPARLGRVGDHRRHRGGRVDPASSCSGSRRTVETGRRSCRAPALPTPRDGPA